MRILIVDFACNGIDLAVRLSKQPEDVEHVYVISGMACPGVWNSDRLTICEGGDRDFPSISKLIQEVSIDFVLNLNSSYGEAGLLEYLAEEGVSALGTNRKFSDTEINKREFKHWLMDNDIPTPRIVFEGLMNDVLSKRDEFEYPIVVKPDMQIGPPTSVIADVKSLEKYMGKAKARLPITENSVLFVVEEFIEGDQVLVVHYTMTDGKGVPISCVATTPVPKSKLNPVGAVFGLNPWSEIDRYRDHIAKIVDRIASIGCASIGFVQLMVGADEKIYVIENNARPAAICSYDPFQSASGLIRALRSGDIEGLRRDSHIAADDEFWIAAPVMHDHASVWLNRDQFSSLREIEELNPFSFSIDGDGFQTQHADRMPTVLFVGAQRPEEAIERYNELACRIEDIYACRVPRAAANLFE